MQKLRVMIVDDSLVIRRILKDALSADPAIEVVGMAPNGKIALAKLPTLKPDIITLDIEMPEMDGLETLTEIRKTDTRLPIVMFSTLTESGASATLEALSRGASDYLTKPANVGSVSASIHKVQNELIPRIKALCKWVDPTNPPSLQPSTTLSTLTSGATTNAMQSRTELRTSSCAFNDNPNRVDALVIGTSTGGPNALATMLPQLPADLPVPVLIVQHMPPVFTTRLAERLNQLCPFEVVEASDREVVEPGKAYVARGDFHMTVRRQAAQVVLAFNQDPPECSCRPAVDVIFRSASKVYGSNVLAVVLTGMGQDGLHGCEAIRNSGGYVIAQDEATSVVWGMPGAVAQANLANKILPLDKIAQEITFQMRQTKTARPQRLAGASTT